ncbi:protein of unassigned function [Methylobacterium oryzae CBMB20]|uniref:Protein of unassigned function n=1 Tax=Methylobacterium oryzae CBMB20 TaxID=693986 RepID=A0A089NXD7_9HYPH|nr:protein of unassigned function [Methylobacterium oryzae CBMB20]
MGPSGRSRRVDEWPDLSRFTATGASSCHRSGASGPLVQEIVS